MNQVLLVDNLASDPDVDTRGGIAQVRLRIASTRSVSTPEGPRDRVTWTQVLAFHGLAESLGRLGKGSRLFVRGRLETAPHEDGEACFNYSEILAEEVELLQVREPGESPDEEGAGGVPPLCLQR
ncbi:MAG: single-stranded DNA-binding protein [Gemmatimonadota bacterium]|jgi:single-strand DNA-binding protein